MDKNNRPVILVVDDIATNITLIQALLKGKNYEVLSACNGIQAIETANQAQPEVILLDLMMPGMDGFEVLARLRSSERTRKIKVVIVSAISKKEDIQRAMDLGADEYIPKPIFASRLYQVLEKMLG